MITLKVNYQKRYSENGTSYNQTITISKELARLFNKDLSIYMALHKKDYYETLYLSLLDKKVNYLKLSTLKRFKEYLDYNFHDLTKRVKIDRNTIIVID